MTRPGMAPMTVRYKQDLPVDVAGRVLAEVARTVAVAPATFLAELRLHLGPDGEVVLATVAQWQRAVAIPAAEIDAAWGRRAPAEEAAVNTVNGQPAVSVSVYPAGSLRARLAAKRVVERTGS